MSSDSPRRPITRKMLLRNIKKRYEYLLLNDYTYGKYKNEFEFLEEFFGEHDDEDDLITITIERDEP